MKRRLIDKELFHYRFVDEEKLKKIEDERTQQKYWTYSLSIIIFCLCSAVFPTFIGYNFDYLFPTIMFWWDMFMYFWLFYFSFKFISLDLKYGVFKSKKFLFMVPILYILLSVVFSILAIFTTHYTYISDTSFSVKITPWYFILIFIPLLLIYSMFCFYAFMICFAKYPQKKKNNDEK